MGSQDIIIQLVNVKYSIKLPHENLTILNDINLAIEKGTSIAITGASGSGKTSLLTIMAGLEKATSGQVYYGQQEIGVLSEDERAALRARYIGFIFQFFQLLPNLTALENVMLPLEINHHPDAKKIALHWIEQVGLIQRINHYPFQLSGGEQQRIAIARAFSVTPHILFADEPTGNLDKQTGQSIIDLLFTLNKNHQTTLVIVTHDELLAQRCQKNWPLVRGTILC